MKWENLVRQGRAKNVGIAWENEELDALYDIVNKANISRVEAAEYVRNGAMSFEDYQKMVSKGVKPETREDVEKKAKLAGVKFAPEAPTTVLKEEIERKKRVKKVVKKETKKRK